MTALIYYSCDFLYTAVKVWAGFRLAAAAFEPACEKRTERIMTLLAAVGLAALNVWNHYSLSLLFSNTMLLAVITLMALISRFLFCRKKRPFWYIFAIYFLSAVGLVLADLFLLTFLYAVSVNFMMFSMNGLLSVSVYRACYLLAWSVLTWILGTYLCRGINFYKNEINTFLKKIWILYLLFLCGMIYFQRLYLQDFTWQMIDRWGFFLSVLILTVTGYVFGMAKARGDERMRLLQQRVDLLGNYYQALSQTYEEKAVLLHDLKNHMRVLRELLKEDRKEEAETYLDQIDGVIKRSGSRNLTNHNILNLVLNAKLQEAQEESIAVSAEFDDMKGLQLQSMEICTVFCNLLDNALEAVKRNKEVRERWIRLSCERKGDLLVISISNPTDEKTLKYEGDFPQTSKTDKKLHGLGLRGVRQVLDAHQGHMNLAIEDQVFCFTAYLNGFTEDVR